MDLLKKLLISFGIFEYLSFKSRISVSIFDLILTFHFDLNSSIFVVFSIKNLLIDAGIANFTFLLDPIESLKQII